MKTPEQQEDIVRWFRKARITSTRCIDDDGSGSERVDVQHSVLIVSAEDSGITSGVNDTWAKYARCEILRLINYS